MGPREITFQKLITKSIHSKVKIQKMNIELAYKKALTDINFEYGVEDLNILVGNYVGNHKKLQNLCNFKFEKISLLNT